MECNAFATHCESRQSLPFPLIRLASCKKTAAPSDIGSELRVSCTLFREVPIVNIAHRIIRIAIPLALVFTMPGMTFAQGQIFINPPRPGVRDAAAAPLKQHLVKVDIADRAAKTRIEQTFINQSKARLEGVYVFPVPKGAAISKLTMVVNGEPVEAKIVKAKEARQTYENIVRQQRDPALLEYVDRDLIRLRVFPIEPESETEVAVEYEEILPYDNGASRYRFGFTHAGKGQEKLSSSRIVVNIETREELKSIYSPTHGINVKRQNERKAKVKFSDEDVTHEGDFELVFGVSPADVAMHVLTYRDDDDEDGYFMLLASPRVGLEDGERTAKRVVFVIDTSGSMGNDGKIDQAKSALKFCLQQLDEEDQFATITFSDEINKSSDTLEKASEANVDRAVEEVEKIKAAGGTNIDEALEEALQLLDEDDDAPAYHALPDRWQAHGWRTEDTKDSRTRTRRERDARAHLLVRRGIRCQYRAARPSGRGAPRGGQLRAAQGGYRSGGLLALQQNQRSRVDRSQDRLWRHRDIQGVSARPAGHFFGTAVGCFGEI